MDRDKWIAALTGFTPFGKGAGSIHWLKEHPRERNGLLAAAAVAGAAFTGGSSLGLLGAGAGAGTAAAGAGAAGLTAAELGAGAGAFGGAALADGAVGAGLGAGGLLGAAPYAGELASVGETGGTMLGGAAPQSISPQLPSIFDGMNWDKAQKGLKLANQFTQQNQPQPIKPAPMPRQQQYAQMTNEALERLKKLYGGMYG